jgi:hypothetical protein
MIIDIANNTKKCQDLLEIYDGASMKVLSGESGALRTSRQEKA